MGSRICRPRAEDVYDPDEMQEKVQCVLDRFDVSAKVDDLVNLRRHRIVVIADDSSSMRASAVPLEQRQVCAPRSRWQELRATLGLIVDLASCFEPSGIDIHFLNRPALRSVRSSEDLQTTFLELPTGTTPLTETLQRVVQESSSNVGSKKQRPVLLFVLTDGQPDGGVEEFQEAIRGVVKKTTSRLAFRIQIMACTDDEEDVGYLDAIEHTFTEVTCTDDYFTEMHETLKDAHKSRKFTRGDWCMRAMLHQVLDPSEHGQMDARLHSNYVVCA